MGCHFAESAAGGSEVPQVLDTVNLLENCSYDLEWEAVGYTAHFIKPKTQ